MKMTLRRIEHRTAMRNAETQTIKLLFTLAYKTNTSFFISSNWWTLISQRHQAVLADMQNDVEMMTSATKKRKHAENITKNAVESAEMLPVNNDSTLENWCIVENLLAVPIEYIFRDVSIISMDASVGWSPATPRSNTYLLAKDKSNETTNHRTKPLLSRIEAQIFLQVNALSFEMDALTSVSVSALQQRVQYREHSTSIQRADHPFLRPIVSLLHTYHDTIPDATIQQVSSIMKDRIIPEFQRLMHQLRQFSEQNWALADTLDDGQSTIGGYHNVLALEKRKLSDLQEEISQRIEGLCRTSISECQDASDIDETTGNDLEHLSMKAYCDQLFQQQNDLVENSENTMDVIVRDDAHTAEMVDRTKSPDEHHDNMENDDEDDDDEVLDEAPERSLTATPVSSPEESPSLIQATTATRASILQSATTKASSPLVAVTTTPVTLSSTERNPITGGQATVSTTKRSGSTFQHPQRQLEKSFRSPAATAESPEENEKENEPSQSSSQRSAISCSSPRTNVKRQRLQRHDASSETPPHQLTAATLSELKPSHETEFVSTDDTGGKGDRLDASTTPQAQSTRAKRFDDDDYEDEDDEEQIIEDKECFRTQSAAEVLTTLATTTVLGLSSSE